MWGGETAVHAGEHPGNAELLLGEQRRDEVVLVVPGRGDDHVRGVELGLLQHPGFARVTDHVVDLRGPLLGDLEDRGVLLDQCDGMATLGEVRRQVPADRARAADHDPHLSAPRWAA